MVTNALEIKPDVDPLHWTFQSELVSILVDWVGLPIMSLKKKRVNKIKDKNIETA